MSQAKAQRDNRHDAKSRCEVCGGTLHPNSRHGVCSRSELCEKERRARVKGRHKRHCVNCGSSLRTDARRDVCCRESCKHLNKHLLHLERLASLNKWDGPATPVCLLCGGARRSNASSGYCRRTPECKRAAMNAFNWPGKSQIYYWQNPNRYRLIAKRSRDRHREKRRSSKILKDRVMGVRPFAQMSGTRHPNWKGGYHAVCNWCGEPLGWVTPSMSRAVKHGHFCRDHRHHWKDLRNA